MRTILNLVFIFFISVFLHAQSNPFTMQCVEPHAENNSSIESLLSSCTNSSPYYNNANLYLPQLSDEIIYLKLNFIFLTKPDGTGNFEQNNPEHVQAIDDIVTSMNSRLLNLQQTGCSVNNANDLGTTRMQVIVNKVWKVDPAWDYLYTGYNKNLPGSINNSQNSMLWPNSTNYYYSYLDNDLSIPSGINIIFANDSNIYNALLNNNYSLGRGEDWAISMESSNQNYSQKLRQFFPNIFNTFLLFKYHLADNPNHPQYPNTPWSTAYAWFYYSIAGGVLHETGHNFNLNHQNNCLEHVMNQGGGNSRNYLRNSEISQMHLIASNNSIRQYFTEDSFKNTSIVSDNNQTWDLNFRLYSNVKIDRNSSLKATCKIIMAPESRFIVKNGSNFIIEGADISSANNQSWNGIKIEGNGYGLILPDTKIDNGYFFMYTDNNVLPNGKIANNEELSPIKNKELKINNSVEEIKIYPNPTGDFINIRTNELIKSVVIINMEGKIIRTLNDNFNQINVQNLPNGSYILKMELADKFLIKKFIKK